MVISNRVIKRLCEKIFVRKDLYYSEKEAAVVAKAKKEHLENIPSLYPFGTLLSTETKPSNSKVSALMSVMLNEISVNKTPHTITDQYASLFDDVTFVILGILTSNII